uniref:Dynein axonemal intermediate chain 7 n=1 Tax=Neogobius melanostomus TaxID=47308 RepID=A0A8C6TW51_9GOBI
KRLQEEEEARLQAERDEQNRLEREEKEKVLQELELKDVGRRENELDELRHLLEGNHNAVVRWKSEETEKAKWESYMRCNGTPDPSVHQEINTYMTLWREDPDVNVTKVLKQCTCLIEKLEELHRETSNLLDIQKNQEAIINLQELIHLKHNLATEEILKEASANIDTETGNMQTVVKDEQVTLCLWANLKKNPRFKGLIFDKVNLGFEIPKQLAISNIYYFLFSIRILTLLQINTNENKTPVYVLSVVLCFSFRGWGIVFLSLSPHHNRTSSKIHAVDLMQYTPLGGVFYYNLFHLPPKPTTSMAGPSDNSKLDDTESLSSPPLSVSVTIPDDVIFLENPQVARWDTAGKQWRMDGITDVSYSEEEAKITFKMECFLPFVLIQDTYPLGLDSAVFTVKGALMNISITVQGNQCMLQTQEERRLSHLTQKWMSCTALQRAMQNSGINIFVNEFTEKYVRTHCKDPLMEHSAYEQMALFSSSCAFTWSKWNAKCGPEHLVMQACEHIAPGPVPNGHWMLYLLGAQRSQKLEMSEGSETFSPDHCPGTEFHSTFIHMLQDHMSAEGIAQTRRSHNLFIDTVQSLLCATRPLQFA